MRYTGDGIRGYVTERLQRTEATSHNANRLEKYNPIYIIAWPYGRQFVMRVKEQSCPITIYA